MLHKTNTTYSLPLSWFESWHTWVNKHVFPLRKIIPTHVTVITWTKTTPYYMQSFNSQLTCKLFMCCKQNITMKLSTKTRSSPSPSSFMNLSNLQRKHHHKILASHWTHITKTKCQGCGRGSTKCKAKTTKSIKYAIHISKYTYVTIIVASICRKYQQISMSHPCW